MAKKLDINSDDARIEVLVSAAKAANGYVYYSTKYTSKVRKGGSFHEQIDIYEKYRRPNSKFSALLKKESVEVVFHPRSVKN